MRDFRTPQEHYNGPPRPRLALARTSPRDDAPPGTRVLEKPLNELPVAAFSHQFITRSDFEKKRCPRCRAIAPCIDAFPGILP